MADLLSLRKDMKRKKPTFVVRASKLKKTIKSRWRKPKGLQNKVKKKLKGYIKMPSQGYRSPRAVRFLHNSGLKEIIVSNIKNLDKINTKEEGILLASTLGTRKKVKIIKNQAGFFFLYIVTKINVKIRPNNTVTFPSKVGPAELLLRAQVITRAAPAVITKMVIPASTSPCPALISCLKGQPSINVEARPTRTMARKVQPWLRWDDGWAFIPKLN